MSDTIDAIQARLSPSRLMTDAKQTIRDATVGRVTRFASRSNGEVDSYAAFDKGRVIAAVKAHPIPFALAGLAATALIVRAAGRSKNGAARQGHTGPEARRKVHGMTANGNRRRLWVGACAGLACWSAWRARQHDLPRYANGETFAASGATGHFEPTTIAPRED
jgi:hypothetical protein